MPFDFPTLFKACRAALRKESLSIRYCFAILFFIAATFFLRCLVQAGRFLDRWLFSAYRSLKVEAPVYIIAAPRSGTTFLHRLLCRDNRFTYFKLYHTLLPSITLIKLCGVLGRADRWLNGALARMADQLSRVVFKSWAGIHETRLPEAEEDEQLFLYTMLSPGVFMFFPFLRELAHVKFLDKLPQKIRLKWMDYYLDSLKRQIYAIGPEKTLLAKNVLIQGRLRSVLNAIPGMRIVYLARDPYEAIPSFVSMYSAVWRQLCPKCVRNGEAGRELAKLLCEYYSYFEDIKSELPERQWIEVRYEDLVSDPEGTVKRIYRELGWHPSEEFLRALSRESARAARYRSVHQYRLEDFGLSEAFLREHLKGYAIPPRKGICRPSR